MVDDDFYNVVGVMKPRAPSAGIGGSLAAESFSNDVYMPDHARSGGGRGT